MTLPNDNDNNDNKGLTSRAAKWTHVLSDRPVCQKMDSKKKKKSTSAPASTSTSTSTSTPSSPSWSSRGAQRFLSSSFEFFASPLHPITLRAGAPKFGEFSAKANR